MRLFRYFDSIGGLATLTTKTMRFASPLVFNDPFELTPRFEKPSDELLLSRLRTKHLVEDYFNNVGSKNGMSREDSDQEYYAIQAPKMFKKLQTLEGWEERALQLKWEMVQNFSKGFRILCCSHREDSLLMWSHYANKHKGIVLEFEIDELIPGLQLSEYAHDVRYRSSPPTIPALHSDLDSFERAVDLALSTKALEWSYEEEVRIKFLSPPQLALNKPHDQSFDPSCIKRVIVGCNLEFQSDEYQSLDRLAEEPAYKHVLFQRAFLDPNDYKLRFVHRPR